MSYTLGEAAKAAGISKTSIHRAIKTGKISAVKDAFGSYQIDPAELHRIYPVAKEGNGYAEHTLEQSVVPEILVETGVLRRETELLRERLNDKDGVIADLRARLDKSEQERRDKDMQLTALLTDQRERPAMEAPAPEPQQAPAQPKGLRGWLHRLTGA